MSNPIAIHFKEIDAEALVQLQGKVAVLCDFGVGLSLVARKLDRAMRGALSRAVQSPAFERLSAGDVMELAYPTGLACEALYLVRLPKRCDVMTARKAGGAIARGHGAVELSVIGENHPRAAEIAYGLALRAYQFETYRSTPAKPYGAVAVYVQNPEQVAAEAAPMAALSEGVFFARDLVNEPANVLNTNEFAARLAAMQELGLEVSILEEDELARLGMGALLGVGQGSESPSKVVVMEWRGGLEHEAPLALVGKGVCFDTGGISIKPAGGMEEMTMDMGGAATVAGVMRALALRKAKANVIGLVGLVENMPDGKAQRPGDVVKSMKGDTIEVINTDAEGRLVLADVLWYAQETYKPKAVIDLATLTGAVIVALGHENAGVFSNDDTLCNAFLRAAALEDEGAWRLPLAPAYDDMLKSRVADMRNSCGREAGSITAAQFLQRFVKTDMPWIHLDIAGTAYVRKDHALGPKGATGWGVRALDRLIRDRFEA